MQLTKTPPGLAEFYLPVRPRHRVGGSQMLLVVKLVTIFMLAAVMQVSASGTAQTVTYSATNVPLTKVLSVIEKQTGYVVFYRKQDIKEAAPVNISLNKADLKTALTELLKDRELEFQIEENTVFIKMKQEVGHLSIPQENPPPITGIIRDVDGKPLLGVNVVIKGTKKGVTTDKNGRFNLDAKVGDVLIVSSIGFGVKEITVSDTENIVIALEVTSSPLDEIQIEAYGKTSRRLSTGNITTIKAEEISKQTIDNPLLALMGKVPNLTISPSSGNFGAKVDMKLRGQNSIAITALSSEPLIIIDGIPYQNNVSAALGTFGPAGSQMSGLSFLNPNDIEQIDVLADADATSIYGSRGANGVILITTKKGKAGETRVNIDMVSGYSQVPKFLDLMNTSQYLEMRKEAYTNDGLAIPDKTTSPNSTNYDLTVWDQERYTDWQEVLLGGKARWTRASATVTGGNSLFQYLIGGRYGIQGTVFTKDAKNETEDLNFSLTGKSVNAKFVARLSGGYSKTNTFTPTADFTRAAMTLAPNAPSLYNEQGELNWEPNPTSPTKVGTWLNPYASLQRTHTNDISMLRNSAEVGYTITDGLSVKIIGGLVESKIRALSITPISSKDPAATNASGSTVRSYSETRSFSLEPLITYGRKIKSGQLNILVGGSFQKQEYNSEGISAEGYTVDAFLRNLGAAKSYFSQNNSSEYKYIAVFGRLNYDWRNKYIVNVSARRDGSSRFGPENKFGSFWSVGGAWIFSNELFGKESLSFISFGKLRGSYGTSGHDAIGDYQYLELYNTVNGNYTYQNSPAIISAGANNPNYHWETMHKMEFGLEMGFFRDRILFNLSYFRNRASDQLAGLPTPATAGTTFITLNENAKIQNSGYEFILNTKNIKSRKISWTSTFTFGQQFSKVIELPEDGAFTGLSRSVKVGEPFAGYVFLYDYRGVNVLKGIYQFKQDDGTTSTKSGKIDGIRLNTTPKTLGLSNSFSYGRIGLDFFMQFSRQLGKNVLYSAPFNFPPGYFSSSNSVNASANYPVEYSQRWQKPGDVTDIRKFTSQLFGPEDPIGLSNAIEGSNQNWVDASFIRLRSLSLSYQLSEKLDKKIGLRSARVYVQGQNLFTLTSYKGLDPETQTAGALPLLRSFTAGISIGF